MLKPVEIVDQYYLEVRCKLLEIAAILDRYDRSARENPDEAVDGDPRLARIQAALTVLYKPQHDPDRTEQIALIFSD